MKKILAIIILGFVLVLVVGGLSLYNLPLGQAMELEIPPELAQVQSAVQQQEDPPPNKTCGGKGLVKIISLGQSSPMDAGHFGADAVRLIWVYYDDPSVVILALPSDLIVDAAVIEPDLDMPLNDIYQLVYDETSSNKPEVKTREATEAVAQAVLDNYGFIPEHYLTVQEEAFTELVDQANIYIDVPETVSDGPGGLDDVPAGVYDPMSGKVTLDYVRILDPALGPYPRISERYGRQNQVLFALLDSALTWENLDDIPEMIKTARKMVVTDLSVSQMNSLACMLEEANNKILLTQVPAELITVEGRQIYENPQDPDNPAYPDLPPSIEAMVEQIEAGFAEE